MMIEQADCRIVAVSGSLRRDSFNTWLVRNCERLAPPGLVIQPYLGLGSLPLYNPDVDDGRFDAVVALRSAIESADGLFIATPEYNHSIPGALKNLLDWASKPTDGTVLAHKPVAIAGVSSGNFGTVRAQAHLRQILHSRDADVVTRPELHIVRGAERFDPDGVLVDVRTAELVTELLCALMRRVQVNRIEYRVRRLDG